MIMATMAAHILRNPTGILISLICFSPLVYSEDYNQRQNRLLFRSQTTFQCESEGFHPDPYDCSIFYRCIDWGEGSENSLQSRFTTFRFQCKEGAIYDIDTSGCIHPSESSRRECKNQQHAPLLINIPRAEALQSAANNRDYGVVEPQQNNPPTSQPPYGNKPSNQGSQIEPESDPNNSNTDEQPPRVTRSPPCSAEGFFAVENDCSHFYRCVGNGKGFLKYEFSCGEGTVWDPENNACNHAWAVQRNDCKSNPDVNGNQEENNNVDGNDNPNPEQISQGPSSPQTSNSNYGYPGNQQLSSPANPSGPGGFNNEYQPNNQPNNGYQPNRPPNNSYPPSNGNSPGQQFPSTAYPAYSPGTPSNGYQPNGFSNNGYPSQSGYPNNQQFSSTTNSPNGQGNLNNGNPSNNNSPNNQNPPSNNYPINQQPPSSANPPNGPENSNNGPSSSLPNNGSSPSGTSCPSEGFHGVENNCKKFIRCVNNGNNGFIKYEFDCAEGTVWDNDSVTCNYPYAVQDPKCRSSASSDPSESNQDLNQQTPSPSTGENVSSAFTPQNSPISNSQSQGQTTPYGNQQSTSNNEQMSSSSNQQTSSSSSQTSSTSSSFSQQTSSSSSSSTSSSQQTTSTNNNNQQGSTTGSNQQTTNNQQTSTTGSNQQSSSSSNQQSTTSGSNQQSTSNQQQGTTSSSNQQTTGQNANTTAGSSGQQGTTSTTNQQSSSNQQGSTTGSNQQTTSNNNQQTTSSGQQTSTTGSNQQTASTSSQQTTSENNSGTTSSTNQQNTNSSTTSGNENTNSGNQSTNNPNKGDTCSAEGFFPSSTSCSKFYRCVSNGGSGFTKYEFNCGPGTVWDPDQNTCNHPWAVQNEKCRSGGGQPTASGSESNETDPNSSASTGSLSSTVPSSSSQSSTTPSTLPSSGSSSSPAPTPSSGTSTTPPIYGGQSTPTSSPPTGSSASNQSPSTPIATSPSSTSKPTNNQTTPSSTTGKPTSTIKPSGSENPSTLGGSTSPDNITSTTPINEMSTNSPTTTPGSTSGNGTKPTTKVNCTKAGFYPHPTDCKKFYRCVDWDGDKGQRFSVYHFDCPAGTIFDPSLDTCNHEESVYPPRQCDGSAQVTEAPTTNCTQNATTPDSSTNGTQPTELPSTSSNSTETTTLPGESTNTTPSEGSSTDTAEPITTTSPTNGSVTTQSSTPSVTDATTEGSTGENTTPPSGTSPSEAPTDSSTDGATYPPSSITTTGKPEESTTLNPATAETTTTSSTSPSETCPEVGPDQFALVCPTGFRRHPKYCNLFYQCTVSQTNEIKVLTLSCSNGTVYDDKKIQCLPPNQAQKCDGSMMDTRNLRKISDNSVSPIAVKSDKSICPGEGSFSFKDDCRLFYKCQKNNEGKLNGFVYQCPEGYGYWNVSKRCEKIEKVPCEGGQKTKPVSKPTLAPVETKNIGHK